MPIYEYRCTNGHRFEVFQSMTDDPVTECEQCGEPVERVFHPVAVHFKGSGFYTTDYARKGAAKAGKDGSKGEESKTGSGSTDSGSKAGSGSKGDNGKSKTSSTAD